MNTGFGRTSGMCGASFWGNNHDQWWTRIKPWWCFAKLETTIHKWFQWLTDWFLAKYLCLPVELNATNGISQNKEDETTKQNHGCIGNEQKPPNISRQQLVKIIHTRWHCICFSVIWLFRPHDLSKQTSGGRASINFVSFLGRLFDLQCFNVS